MTGRSFAAIVALILIVGGCGTGEPEGDTPAFRARNRLEQVHLRQLARAVDSVEWSLQSMQDGGGYQAWTPASAVPRLVASLNAANSTLPGEPTPPGPAISFVADRCAGPWQVVLRANDADSTITALGFSTDCGEPILSKTFTVSAY